MAEAFDSQQAQHLGAVVAGIYARAQTRFRLSARDVTLAALGSCIGMALRAGMSERELQEALHSFWNKVANGPQLPRAVLR